MDENTKTEPTEIEKMADAILPNQTAEDGKGGEVKSEGSQAEKSAGVNGAGWRTVLPMEYREDAKDSENLSSYLAKLKEASKGPDETDEDWEDFYNSIGAAKDSAERKKAEAMREAGISTKSAESLMQNLKVQALSEQAESLRARRDELESYLADAKSRDKTFTASLDNGMKAFAEASPDQFLRAKKLGILSDPAFVSVLHALGKANTEAPLISGSNGGKGEEKIDQLNPYGY